MTVARCVRATAPRRPPAGGERQRRGDVRGAAQADVRAQRRGVAEHVQRADAARTCRSGSGRRPRSPAASTSGCHGATTCTSWPRAATDVAIGSMNVPTLSPGNRGYDVVTITTTWRMVTAPCAKTQPPRHDQRLDEHRARDLRLPLPPLDEDDRHFADPAAAPRAPRRASRPGTRSRPTPCASSGSRASASRRQQRKPLVQSLGDRPRHRADVAVGEGAEEDPVQRPVHDADAVQVARADDDVVVGGRRGERRQVLGIVRQVRVHLADRDRRRAARARAAGRRCTSGRARAARCGA